MGELGCRVSGLGLSLEVTLGFQLNWNCTD